MGFENSGDIYFLNTALIRTNGIGKVRLGVDIFDKRILVRSSLTWCFKIQSLLQKSYSCSQQSINRYHSEWCTNYQDPFSLITARGKGKRERERNLSFSALLFSFFPSRVYCHVIPHRVLFSHKKLEL